MKIVRSQNSELRSWKFEVRFSSTNYQIFKFSNYFLTHKHLHNKIPFSIQVSNSVLVVILNQKQLCYRSSLQYY